MLSGPSDKEPFKSKVCKCFSIKRQRMVYRSSRCCLMFPQTLQYVCCRVFCRAFSPPWLKCNLLASDGPRKVFNSPLQGRLPLQVVDIGTLTIVQNWQVQVVQPQRTCKKHKPIEFTGCFAWPLKVTLPHSVRKNPGSTVARLPLKWRVANTIAELVHKERTILQFSKTSVSLTKQRATFKFCEFSGSHTCDGEFKTIPKWKSF
jgi:hypothetical protein